MNTALLELLLLLAAFIVVVVGVVDFFLVRLKWVSLPGYLLGGAAVSVFLILFLFAVLDSIHPTPPELVTDQDDMPILVPAFVGALSASLYWFTVRRRRY